MNHLSKKILALSAFAVASITLASCGNVDDTDEETLGPTEFTTHELAYGGDSEETLSFQEFFSSAQNNYQKSIKYKNALATLTSDQPFYDENDRDDYFKDFEELRFVMLPINEDRSFYLDKFFYLIPISFDSLYYSAPIINNYRVGRAIGSLNYGIRLSTEGFGDFDTFYRYKVKCENMEILFSEDYYPVKVSWKFDSISFEMSFKYYNVSDLPNKKEEVDRETFLIHAYARANQPIKANHVRTNLTLTNARIAMIPQEEDPFIMDVIYGTGTAYEDAKLASTGIDKTALSLLADPTKRFEYEELWDDFPKDQPCEIYQYYLITTHRYLFNTYNALSDALSYSWSQNVERKFSLSPLRIEQRNYSQSETDESYALAKVFTFEFNNDGLITYYSSNSNSETAPDELVCTFTYTNV